MTFSMVNLVGFLFEAQIKMLLTNTKNKSLNVPGSVPVVSMGTKCIVSNLHRKYEFNTTEDKEVIEV